MTEARLREILNEFPNVAVAVVGDFFLDKYLVIDRSLSEISLETGKEVYRVVEIRHSPGAAGTVCNNLAALQVGTIYAVGLVGDDGQGYELRQDQAQRGINLEYLVESPDVFTPTYIKPMERAADGSEQEMNRLDIKNRQPLSAEIQQELIDHLRAAVAGVHGVIVADQVQERNCGVITDQVRAELARRAEEFSEKVFCVDSRTRIGEFDRLILKPNMFEAVVAVEGHAPDTVPPARAERSAQRLAACTGRPVFLTMGAEGISVCTREHCERVPGIPVTSDIDIVGAGDSATAGIVLSLCAGASPTEAAFMGNLVAAITIQQIGTTGTASPQQVLEQFSQYSGRQGRREQQISGR